MIDKIEKEAIRELISRHKDEFQDIKFKKKKEFEVFGGFVR